MQKVKSSTFKKINYLLFLKIPKFMCKTNPIFNFQFIHKKTPKLKTNTCKSLLFFQTIWNKYKKWSLTPSKISIIIFFKKNSRFVSRTSKILNFHVSLNKTQKLKTNTCEFLFFSTILSKMQKVMSNTFKNINCHIFGNNTKISI